MPFSWVRPESVKIPTVFAKFRAPNSEGDEVLYKIEDLQENRFDDVIEIMKNKHLSDEPMYSSKGIREDPISFQEMISNWQNMLQQKISLVCYKEGNSDKENSEEIVAVNILGVVTEGEFDAPHNVNISTILNRNSLLNPNFHHSSRGKVGQK